jgi:ribosomal protein S18 acetylase RimI-like enzyme
MLRTVRPWRPQDRDAILALNAELQEHERARRPSRRLGAEMTEGYVRALEAELAREAEDAALFVAESTDGDVLGFATCFVVEDELERNPRQLRIEDVVVAEGARRQGIGRALVAAACRFAGERGVQRVVLSVLTVNEEAAAAYAALGFQPVLLTLERWLPDAETSIR